MVPGHSILFDCCLVLWVCVRGGTVLCQCQAAVRALFSGLAMLSPHKLQQGAATYLGASSLVDREHACGPEDGFALLC